MLYAAFLLLSTALATPIAETRSVTVSSTKSLDQKRASSIETSSHVLTLSKPASVKGYNARSAAHLLGVSRSARLAVTNYTTTLTSLFIGEEFATDISFGGQTFLSIVDTGSSDTWLIESGFSCVDQNTVEPETEEYCRFGPTYNVTDTFSQIPNENFRIKYGDGEFLTGVVGYEEVTLAGLTVNQTVSLVNYAAWNGDGVTSGLIGLAYPALTSAYNGTNATADRTAGALQIPYNPIFTTMYDDGLVAPLFSLAILRDISGPAGYLALGGLPPIDIKKDFASTPILITTIGRYPVALDFYTINISGMKVNSKTIKSSIAKTQYIVDSGTTLNYFPTDIADAINAAFEPPAVWNDNEGAYLVNCTAKAPSFAIKIGGMEFYTNALDMILDAGTDENGNMVCISGIDDGGALGNLFILGDTFLKNVVAVFDIGAGMMRFSPRVDYPSNDDV